MSTQARTDLEAWLLPDRPRGGRARCRAGEDPALADSIRGNVSFVTTAVDRITPRPTSRTGPCS